MFASIGLVMGFGSASNLASAYGVAVSATMAVTTVLFYGVAGPRLGWGPLQAGLLAGIFLAIDVAFLGVNLFKIGAGGWLPISVAGVLTFVMATWRTGGAALARIGRRRTIPLQMLLEEREVQSLTRVPGTAVFMNNAHPDQAPPVLLHHLKHNKMLHERVVVLAILAEEVPVVPAAERVEAKELGHGFYQVIARYGFMETPDVAAAAARCCRENLSVSSDDITYYLGRPSLIPAPDGSLARRWRKHVFVFLTRNARPATQFFGVPPDRVVELGMQIRF